MSTVNIMLNGSQGVGEVQFTKPDQFPAIRTLAGIKLQIPASVNFEFANPLLLENLRAAVSVGAPPTGMEIGTARYEEPIPTPRRKMSVLFSMDLTVETLAAYEILRDGGEPEFYLAVSGDVRRMLPCQIAHRQIATTSDTDTFRATVQIRYSRESWTRMLRAVDFRDSVMIEIPFTSKSPDGWDGIWKALRDARHAFDSGGSTGWRSAVTRSLTA